MGSRYFFISFLPDLSFDASPELSLHEIEFYLRLNLSSREMHAVNQLYTLYDLENIRLFLMDLPMGREGTIPHNDIREALENDECPLPCVQPFFTLYPTLEERKKHVRELYQRFFKQDPSSLQPFVRKYFWLEHISRILFAHLRAASLGKSFESTEEIGFDINDVKSWPECFLPLLSLWQSRHKSPSDLENGISRWKFETIGSFTNESPPFSLEYILAYLLQLRLLESRRELNNPNPNILERFAKAVQ